MKNHIDIYSFPIGFPKDLELYGAYLKDDNQLDGADAWSEMYGWINSLQHEGSITKETADFLRERYLYDAPEMVIHSIENDLHKTINTEDIPKMREEKLHGIYPL